MSEKDGKTEKPTAKKLRDARKKGEMARSQELSSAVSFAVFALAGTYLASYALERAFVTLRNGLSGGFDVSGFENNLAHLGIQAVLYFLLLAAPFLGIAFLAGLIVSIVQTGFYLSGEPLKFKFSRLNPVSGLKNLFSVRAVFQLAKNLLKLLLIAAVVDQSLDRVSYYALNSGSVGSEKLFFVVLELVQDLSKNLAILLFILGIADFIYQKYDYRKKLMMTKQEIKDEFKEMEGDPQIKAKRRARHRQLTRKMLKDVESASVVVTNPTHLALAIRYDRETAPVPVVVAKGADLMAQRIKERAAEHNVPVIEDKPVARALYKQVEAGQTIPADMYQAIAEILALVYQMEQLKKHKI